jgi:hypothetical protein
MFNIIIQKEEEFLEREYFQSKSMNVGEYEN